VSKPPQRYEPVEQVEDDYADDDYDTEESPVSSTVSDEDTSDIDEESDADEYGNLDGFVVADKNDSSESDTDGEPSVPDKRRAAPVKKRPVARKRST
jgi:hypothetical protein